MRDPIDDQRRFAEEMRTLLAERVSIGAVAAACVYPFFIVEDVRLAPDQWERMATLRLISSIFFMFLFGLSKTATGERHPYKVTVFALVTAGLLKTILNPPEVQGAGSLYFGGHALMIVGALGLLPLSFWRALILGAVTQLSFSLPTALFAHPIDHVAFAMQNMLMLTMLLLLSLSCHLNYNMHFREFQLRSRLYAVRQRATEYG